MTARLEALRGPIRFRSIVIACVVSLTLSTSVYAQQMYVDDKLVLNVHSEVNQGGEKVATIETGDQVELLERADNSARVRLPDGREGWVGANYLTAEAPAIVRLKELQTKEPQTAGPTPEQEAAQKKLTDEVARLKKQNTELTEEANKLRKAAAATPVTTPSQVAPPVAPPVTAEPATELLDESPPRDPLGWVWPAITVLVGGVAFLFGYQTLARKIRRKYGRVNII